MSYRFVLGASGAGKSTTIQREIAERAAASLREGSRDNYIFLVPEQFTMQTQKELVKISPSHTILNIDVLSFGRLTHRIFEEVGVELRSPLSEIGKSLALRRLAGQRREELPVIGGNLKRSGYIAEVKSILSEFMQYGLSPDDVEKLCEFAAGTGRHGALTARLHDLKELYRFFLEFEQDRFVTAEETLDLLNEALLKSAMIKDTVVVFDGFTGFTPVQYRVIATLMREAKEVIFTFTIGSEEAGFAAAAIPDAGEEQDLFHLTKKSVREICRIGEEAGIPRGRDLFVGLAEEGVTRTAANPVLAHLEKQLFRYPLRPYGQSAAERISIAEASDVRAEVKNLIYEVQELTKKGYQYRDMAVVAGDLAVYADDIEQQALKAGIPVYIDKTRDVIHNPLMETIRSALQIPQDNFAYEGIFRYFRAGLSGLTREEIDLLDNYCLRCGIRGKKRWMLPFEEPYEAIRQKFMGEIEPLLIRGTATGGERVKALYSFLHEGKVQQKMEALAAEAELAGNPSEASELRQIYPAVIELMENFYDLLGEEKIPYREFTELLEAGFAEIRIGTLPQMVDRLLVGDLERTRLTQVKILFVLGVNDGAIPKATNKGGILSDLDREFLASSGIELAPTPRQEIYTQRLYLYLNLTKPTDRLYLSYANVAEDGHGQRPSYLISMVRSLFPAEGGIPIAYPEGLPMEHRLSSREDALFLLSEELRKFAEGYFENPGTEADRRDFLTLYDMLAEDPEFRQKVETLTDSAFRYYRPVRLSERAVRSLYGTVLAGSISRLEKCAECYGKHFFSYGLSLRERDTHEFTPRDSGNVLHECLELFGKALIEEGSDWRSFDEALAERLVDRILTASVHTYNDQLFFVDERTAYRVDKMRRLLLRTTKTLQQQIRKGSFMPFSEELTFGYAGSKGEVRLPGDLPMEISLPGPRRVELADEAGAPLGTLLLNGRIDRVDVCRDRDVLYVKILDYKSGFRDLSEDEIRKGRSLQLLLYMEEAVRILQGLAKENEVLPAALLYSRLQDKPVEGSGDAAADEKRLREEMRPTGMVISDDTVLDLLDEDRKNGAGKSEALPLSYTSKGSPYKSKSLISRENYEELRQAADEKVKEIGRDILLGEIGLVPCESGQKSACAYCEFKAACGFDRRLPGMEVKE